MYRSPRGLRIDFFVVFPHSSPSLVRSPQWTTCPKPSLRARAALENYTKKRYITNQSADSAAANIVIWLKRGLLFATFAKSCLVGEPWHDDHRHSVVDRLVGAHQAAVGYEKAAVGVACIGKIMSKIPS